MAGGETERGRFSCLRMTSKSGYLLTPTSSKDSTATLITCQLFYHHHRYSRLPPQCTTNVSHSSALQAAWTIAYINRLTPPRTSTPDSISISTPPKTTNTTTQLHIVTINTPTLNPHLFFFFRQTSLHHNTVRPQRAPVTNKQPKRLAATNPPHLTLRSRTQD